MKEEVKREVGSSATSNVRDVTDVTDVTDVSPSEEGRRKKAITASLRVKRRKTEEGRRKKEKRYFSRGGLERKYFWTSQEINQPALLLDNNQCITYQHPLFSSLPPCGTGVPPLYFDSF
ncbi:MULTISPECIES: hypothetical protein [Microcoleaceae]|uniref:hypothetical protein n=1 Tax=Microcoleaceae TaxID=1892252 RepID=UPI00187FF542|nr:hypothetical protein [Tychonema sp. LEGE 06208]MBE9162324.1 hypothetical protein [Tychonema sp. LEGE 06208]